MKLRLDSSGSFKWQRVILFLQSSIGIKLAIGMQLRHYFFSLIPQHKCFGWTL